MDKEKDHVPRMDKEHRKLKRVSSRSDHPKVSSSSSGENISMSECSNEKVELTCEESMREILRLQRERMPTNIFILTDERDIENSDLAKFGAEIEGKIIPGLKMKRVFPMIKQNPCFGKGTIWVFMGGIHDMIEWKPLQECLDFGCLTPQKTIRPYSSVYYSTNYLIKESLQLNLDILRNTENDVALFSGLIPVRPNLFNAFSLTNRNCLTNHKAKPIVVSHPRYTIYLNAVAQFNKFAKYHATTLGFSPWSLDEPEVGIQESLLGQLSRNGFNLHPNELREREKRVELLCQELLATSSLNLEERGRAILLQGLNRKITEQILRSYFEVYGQIEMTSVRYRSLGAEHKTAYGYILFTSKSSVTSLLTKGSQFVIDGVTLLATRISKEPNAEIQDLRHDHIWPFSEMDDPKTPIKISSRNKFLNNLDRLEANETVKSKDYDSTPKKIRTDISTPLLSTHTEVDSRSPAKDLAIVYEKIEAKSKGFVSIQPVRDTDWCVVWKRDGRFYFHNHITKESVWEKPSVLVSHPKVKEMIATPPPKVVALLTMSGKSTETEQSTVTDSVYVPSSTTMSRRLTFSAQPPRATNMGDPMNMGSKEPEEWELSLESAISDDMRRKSLSKSLEENSFCLAPLERTSFNTSETASSSENSEDENSDTLRRPYDGDSDDSNNKMEHNLVSVASVLQNYRKSMSS